MTQQLNDLWLTLEPYVQYVPATAAGMFVLFVFWTIVSKRFK